MLTIEEMEKIKSEEIYRDEIRKKLSENKDSSFSKKSWRFLNSSFGIWLLSTVIVGLIVYFYNMNKLQNEISVNEAATIHKLETESSHRLQQFTFTLSKHESTEIYDNKDKLAYMIDGILFNSTTHTPIRPAYIFPEFKERTMSSLLYEIGRLKSDQTEASTITAARKIIREMQNCLLEIEAPPKEDFALSRETLKSKLTGDVTEDEQKNLSDYESKEKIFEKGDLTEYNNLIQKKLEDLLKLVDSNSYLKDLLEK